MEDNLVDALVCERVGDGYTTGKVRLDSLRADEVLVRIVATGVCHTDFSVANGSIPVSLPLVAGHEGAGVVEDVHPSVTSVVPGDHVLLSFSYCKVCAPCRRGQPAYCVDAVALNFGARRQDGSTAFSSDKGSPISSHFFGQSSFARKTIVRAVSTIKIDKSLPLDILCTFGCGIQTGAGTVLNVLKPTVGASVAVFGVGAVGLSGIIAATLTPATKIIAVDILESKLELARSLGATHTINSTSQNVRDEIMRLTNGYGIDRAFDATGNVKVIADMIACGAPDSKVVTVGAPPHGAKIEIEPLQWLQRGVSYLGAHQGSSNPSQFLPLLIEYWQSGRLPVEKLIKTYRYDQLPQVERDLKSGTCVKAVLLWD